MPLNCQSKQQRAEALQEVLALLTGEPSFPECARGLAEARDRLRTYMYDRGVPFSPSTNPGSGDRG